MIYETPAVFIYLRLIKSQLSPILFSLPGSLHSVCGAGRSTVRRALHSKAGRANLIPWRPPGCEHSLGGEFTGLANPPELIQRVYSGFIVAAANSFIRSLPFFNRTDVSKQRVSL